MSSHRGYTAACPLDISGLNGCLPDTTASRSSTHPPPWPCRPSSCPCPPLRTIASLRPSCPFPCPWTARRGRCRTAGPPRLLLLRAWPLPSRPRARRCRHLGCATTVQYEQTVQAGLVTTFGHCSFISIETWLGQCQNRADGIVDGCGEAWRTAARAFCCVDENLQP